MGELGKIGNAVGWARKRRCISSLMYSENHFRWESGDGWAGLKQHISASGGSLLLHRGTRPREKSITLYVEGRHFSREGDIGREFTLGVSRGEGVLLLIERSPRSERKRPAPYRV